MSRPNFIIGCVGKPSSGKSTFFNAATDGNAKIGNFPFTTIEPNEGVSYYDTTCPCKNYNVLNCKPQYGKCEDGFRSVPVILLDVAGLIPGASEGRGLGNKFLDDLRHANVLIHIIDISGNTNEKGETTVGYDASSDHDWLLEEIELWIFNNIFSRWSQISRRHAATNSSIVSTLLSQFSGYGANENLILKVCDDLNFRDPVNLNSFDKNDILNLVRKFIKVRFPFILALNKSDSPNGEKNLMKIIRKFDEKNVVICSGLAECFLKKMRQQKYILYKNGDNTFKTFEDVRETEKDHSKILLRSLDEKLQNRLEKIKDLVLFRYGSTGIQAAINKAVEICKMVVAYPVKSFKAKNPFVNSVLLHPNTTVRHFARILNYDLDKHFAYAEGVDGRRIAEDEIISDENNNQILKIVTSHTNFDFLNKKS